MLKRKMTSKKVQELLAQLDEFMENKLYHEVDEMLTEYPNLIHDATPRCEVPLVMAIRHWDPKLITSCIKHGADPEERHLCSKDGNRPKIPKLILNEEFAKRTKRHHNDDVFEANYKTYTQMLVELTCISPFKKGNS